MPEFLSATLLPGRGMNMLQITAYLPGKGEVRCWLLRRVDEAAVSMTGTGSGCERRREPEMGGAIEAPWAGRIYGRLSPDGSHICTQWRGRQPDAACDDAGDRRCGGATGGCC